MYLEDIDDDPVFNPSVTYPGVELMAEDYGDMITDKWPNKDDLDDEAIGKYLNMELIFSISTNDKRQGCVVKHLQGLDGNLIGRAHSNPYFDTSEYEVEFADSTREKYQANLITENMYAQVDDEGNQFQILEEIIDHHKNYSDVPILEGTVWSTSGTEWPKIMTRGWEHLVRFKDQSLDWVPLKDLKESNPIELAEYAVANCLIEEPAFKWWVLKVLHHCYCIISKVKSCYWCTTHKFGIKLPHSIEKAIQINEVTGTDFWQRAINREMAKVKVAWKVHEGHTPEQVHNGEVPELQSFQEIGCHCIFDVKMDFTHKCCFVAGGHMTEAPSTNMYSSIISHDSIRLAFLITALNGVDILSCDLLGECLLEC